MSFSQYQVCWLKDKKWKGVHLLALTLTLTLCPNSFPMSHLGWLCTLHCALHYSKLLIPIACWHQLQSAFCGKYWHWRSISVNRHHASVSYAIYFWSSHEWIYFQQETNTVQLENFKYGGLGIGAKNDELKPTNIISHACVMMEYMQQCSWARPAPLYTSCTYRPYPCDHFWLCHSLPDGKSARIPLAAVCKVYVRREVAFGYFDSQRPQTCGDCTKKLTNGTNGRRKLILS